MQGYDDYTVSHNRTGIKNSNYGSCVLYANMTNGLELANDLGLAHKVCRIQSTLLEQKSYNRLINDIDYEMLMDMMHGVKIYVLDCKSRSYKPTRACWQGLPIIKYIVTRRWFNMPKCYKCFVKGVNITNYASEIYRGIDFRKIDYFKSGVDMLKPFDLKGICAPTDRDSDRSLLKDHIFNDWSPYYTPEEMERVISTCGEWRK